eukprot:2874860-Rhodomonas_salina.1
MCVSVLSVSLLSLPLSAALAASVGCTGTVGRSCSARPAVPVAGPWCHTPTTARRLRVVSGQFLLLPLLPDRHQLCPRFRRPGPPHPPLCTQSLPPVRP